MNAEQHNALQDVESGLVELWNLIVRSDMTPEAVAALVAPYGLTPTDPGGGVSGYSELHDALAIDRSVEAHGGVDSAEQDGQS